MNFYDTINYDAGRGAFAWAVSRPGCTKGSPAGYVNVNGYLVIKLGRQAYQAHRLAWFLVHGAWPAGEIDHINGNRLDNRLCNLRVVNHSQNMQNKREAMANNKSCGLLGVTWNKQHKRWQSKLMVNKKAHHVGYFETPELAHAAYVALKRQLHPACTI